MPIFALLIAAALFLSANAFSADWPFYRGPNRNGIADVKFDPVDNEPERLWKADVGDIGRHSCPVVVNGKLYIIGGQRGGPFYVYCFDANSGEELWKSQAANSHSTVAVQDGRIYALGDDRHLRCFDANTGTEVWTTERIPQPPKHQSLAGSAVIWEDLVIVNALGGYAFHRDTGKVAWSHEGLHGLATPVLFSRNGERAVAIFLSDRVVARNPRTGDEIWSIPWKTDPGNNACDPVFVEDDSKVFLCTRYGMGRALWDVSGDEPKEIWFHQQGAHVYSSGVWYGGELYAFANNFIRLDLKTGEHLWNQWKSPRADSVLVLGGKMVLLSEQGEMIVGKPSESAFVELSRAQIHRPQARNVPAYWEGKLYVRNHKGELVCVQVSK